MIAAIFLALLAAPALMLLVLARVRVITRRATVTGLILLAALLFWANHDITSSHSSTAAIGWIVVPPVLFVAAITVVVIDRLVAFGQRLTHRGETPPPITGLPDSNDWSGLPPS